MAQFIVYSSTDANGPGLIFGSAGDLLRVLDLILVNGYTGKAAAGWTKPIANASNCGCYKPPSGSRMTLYINDAGSNVTSTFKEAWATGWESITAVSSPVGTGVGQFPLPAQQLTTGHVVVRKSTTADSTNGRSWIAFADGYTLYLFICPGDTVGTYNGALFFGDIYSFKGSTDTYRCIIAGAAQENSSGIGAQTVNSLDIASAFATTSGNHPGHWMPRNFSGQGTSIQVFKLGDVGKSATSSGDTAFAGAIQIPNGPDNCFYLSSLVVAEFTSFALRGRMRGMIYPLHSASSFTDGQLLVGANDFAGRTYQLVRLGAASGVWGIEVSNTLDTN